MPINEPSAAYKSAATQVARVRDCAAGSDAIKAKGDTYLPKLDAQTEQQYNAYKARGYYLPVVAPSVKALTGAIMRKPLTNDKSDTLEVDFNGLTDDEVATLACAELFVAGRGGYLVEVDKAKFYSRESIINEGENFIALLQQYKVASDDPYTPVFRDEILELTIIDGIYTQRIWRQIGKSKKFQVTNVIVPNRRGEPLDFIPFVLFNTFTASDKLTPPALLEMSDISLDHYRLATDLRHGLHFTALPTMFVFGDMRDDKGNPIQLKVGPGSANHITDTTGRAELLEFTGAGLGSIRETISDDLKEIAAVGARMFQDNSSGVRAAETARIEQSGESATLATIANSVGKALTQVYNHAAWWAGDESDPVTVTLNTDFLSTNLSAQDITALMGAYIQGGLSLDDFLWNMKQGERLMPGVSLEDTKAKIQGGELDLG